jgi:SAM-dependent methyltransferase
MSTEWEVHYQQGDTPWDKGGPSPGLVDLLATEPLTGRVLVPGSGAGHDVRAIAAQTSGEVLGLDIAPSAARLAQSYPVVGHERYAVADLFNLPAELRGSFDLVWEHTCFCAIDPSMRPAYVEAVAGALKPGGRLVAIFYLDPGQPTPEDGPPFEVSIAELDRLFLPRFELVREWLPEHAYPGREGREWMRIMSLRA